MSTHLLAQFFGFVGLALALSIYQVNKRKNMLRINIAAASLYTIQYVLLGAYTGAALNVIGGTRNYTFYKVSPNKKHYWVFYIFIFISVAGTVLTWQGPISILALLGSVCGTFSIWQKKPKYIRRWALLSPPLWFTYNLISGSYPGMLGEIIMLTSNLIGEYRFDTKNRTSHQIKNHFIRSS